MRHMLSLLLKKEGYGVDEAAEGAEGAEKARTEKMNEQPRESRTRTMLFTADCLLPTADFGGGRRPRWPTMPDRAWPL